MTQNKVRAGLRLTENLNKDLTGIAHEMGVTKNQLIVNILWDWVKQNPPERRGGKGGKTMEKEMALLQALGEEGLKEIGGQIAEIVRQHGLQKSPDLCRMLFSYMSDVIDGWNRV